MKTKLWVTAALPINLWIGSAGTFFHPGNTFPGATTPFGMVRLSPDTRTRLPFNTSGYQYSHKKIQGFSHTRLSGAGIAEGGVLRVVPTLDEGDFKKHRATLKLDHSQEEAVPGYYSARFVDDGLKVELTATPHCGVHRYSREKGHRPIRLLLDGASHLVANRVGKTTQLQVDPSQRSVSGRVHLEGPFSKRYGGQSTFYYVEWTGKAEQLTVWDRGVGLVFDPSLGAVDLKVCLSSVSEAGARLNFDTEVRARNFSELQALAQSQWAERLGRIQAEFLDQDQQIQFNTALYHSMVMPTLYSDVDGNYRGMDGQIHSAKGFNYTTDLSLWDTFRTTHPLLTLIDQSTQLDVLKSLLAMGEVHGILPRWPAGSGDAGDMIGAPANFLFAESYLKKMPGLTGAMARSALKMMAREAHGDSPEAPAAREIGCVWSPYCPSDQTHESVSKTLEYAWAASAAAGLADALGEVDLAHHFERQAQNFQNLWDPKTRYFRPRTYSGRFERFSPHVVSWLGFLGSHTDAYTEGSAEQWRFYVPHAGRELANLFGGAHEMVRALENFLKRAPSKMNSLIPTPYYWHGNEQNFHTIYLFNELGRPDLTQKWVRWALSTRYANRPDGLDGNDDAGAMSSWYVLSALGLYPQAGTDRYWLGSPSVTRAEMELSGGHHLKIRVKNQGPKQIYVRSVKLNGVELREPVVTHQALMDSILEFEMGASPRAIAPH